MLHGFGARHGSGPPELELSSPPLVDDPVPSSVPVLAPLPVLVVDSATPEVSLDDVSGIAPRHGWPPLLPVVVSPASDEVDVSVIDEVPDCVVFVVVLASSPHAAARPVNASAMNRCRRARIAARSRASVSSGSPAIPAA